MIGAFALPAAPNFSPSFLLLAATRSWRSARDGGRPVQAALFETLDAHRCGILAPVFASLISIYESCCGRPIRVGGPPPAGASTDEARLLDLLDRSGSGGGSMMMQGTANFSLARAMQIAVRSTRIMIRLALETVGDFPRVAGRRSASRREAGQPRARRAGRRSKAPWPPVEMLRDAYPVTAKILGEPGFEAAALAFARRNPPTGVVGIGYGSSFAQFLAEQPRTAEIPYLADVAALERMRTEAHLAADAAVLELRDLDPVDEAGRQDLRLPLHPATGLAWMTTPAVTIWQAHHDGVGTLTPERRAEGALVTCPAGAVALHRIGRAEHRMLSGLRLRESVGEAAAATAVLYPATDTGSILASLVNRGAFARAS